MEQEQENLDETIHAFNVSPLNSTVIEKASSESHDLETPECPKSNSCEGSDSGVEVIESCTLQRTISSNSQEFESITPAQSCDSSIISCCSHYEDAFNVLVRRNSTLLDDYKLRCVDGTSENGSESSSVASTKITKRAATLAAKKKVSLEKRVANTPPSLRSSTRTKPPITPRASTSSTTTTTPKTGSLSRTKSTDRGTPHTPKQTTRTKPVPDNLNLKKEVLTKKTTTTLSRTPSQTRTTSVSTHSTPTDDGRWPSNFSRPTPAMTRSLRGILPGDFKHKEVKNTLEKYATLPRRRRERSVDLNMTNQNDPTDKPDKEKEREKPKARSRENSTTRTSVSVSSPLMRKKELATSTQTQPQFKAIAKVKRAIKTKIYHEIASQTALDCQDIDKALAGIHFNPVNPQDVEKDTKQTQVNLPDDKQKSLEEQLATLQQQFQTLKCEHAEKCKQFDDASVELSQERHDKDCLRQELKTNNERVVAMLGCYGINNVLENSETDNLRVLETRLQKVTHIIIKQEEEISKLNEYCRTLQRTVDKMADTNRALTQHNQEHEDLQEFLQTERDSAAEVLKENEAEVKRMKNVLTCKEQELDDKHEECKHLVRSNEQKRQENLGLQARFTALEAKCRELLVHQGSTVSGAAVALTSLNSRLDSLVDQLTISYNFTDEDLDDVIFHNEAFSNSSSSPETPDNPLSLRKFPEKTPSPKRGSSFIAAVIGAIKNATTASTFHRENSKDTITDNSENSTELLDSETEPCLMMEHVLEDVVVPDGHSVNMISSGHSMIISTSLRLSHTESLNSLSQAIRNRERCEAASKADTLSDLPGPVSLVDQVIDADNLLTRLLKIIRIIQTENEEYMNELQDDRDTYLEQVNSQRDSNKIVAKQLKDWEHLGAKLKCEVKELFGQLSKKNAEIEDIKNELNSQRQEVEKLNQDVCNLSTILSKSEMEMKIKEEEAAEALRKWENEEGGGEMPSGEVLGRLLLMRKELTVLHEQLKDKEKQLNELTQEYIANRQVLNENLREAITEAKKQYNAIDNALESLQSIQPVVQQCPTLLKLQRDLEETSFQSASAMPLVVPPDLNANAAILAAMGSLAPPINSSA